MNPTSRSDTQPAWLMRALECSLQVGLAQALQQLAEVHQRGECSDMTWVECQETLDSTLYLNYLRLALTVYEQILALSVVLTSAWLVLGHLQAQLGQRRLAVESLLRVLQSAEASPQNVLKAANLLVRVGDQGLALSAATSAFKAMGRPSEHATTLLDIAQQTAHWPLAQVLTEQLHQAYVNGAMTGIKEKPRAHLQWFGDETINLYVIKARARQNLLIAITVKPLAFSAKGRRLRVCYLSSDIRVHPAARLIMSLLCHHDRNAVELFMYCSGWDDGSELRQALEVQFDKVHSVQIKTPHPKPQLKRAQLPLKDQYRVDVVTSYYRVEPEILQRCCASVAAQSWPCDHFWWPTVSPKPCLRACLV